MCAVRLINSKQHQINQISILNVFDLISKNLFTSLMVLVVVLITSLVTFLILIITSVTYLITLIVDESDDVGPDALGIDTHDFTLTPVESPLDQPQNGSNQPLDGLDNDHHRHINCDVQRENVIIGLPCQPRPEDLQSALMNARLLDIGQNQLVKQDSGGHNESNDGQGSAIKSQTSDLGLSSWEASADAQKNLIASQLGATPSKQLFEDFDTKEMQLGGTGLHWCKSRKSLDKLIKLGLPTEIVNKRHETALHVAVRKHKLQVLIGLLNYGANVECRNDNGETPLIMSCKVNDIFACQLLLVYDADFNVTDNLGLSARHYTSSICDKHKSPQQLPSAAHLILAMLNAIGARRCQESGLATDIQTMPMKSSSTKAIKPCTDGCSQFGTYNGNSYNRWPNYQTESLYKRHMFSDIIEDRKRCKMYDSSRSVGENQEKKSRLLCIDGGGLRGVLVCQIMIEMEKYLKKPMISYFDWVGGTSVGAFLACALCNGTSLHELRRICFDAKDEVFSGCKPYNSKFIERVLKRTYGASTRMSDVKDKKLAVTTVIADRDPCQLRIFRNYKSPASMLEVHGFSSEMFNNMSGHSIVTKRQLISRKSLTDPINHSKLTLSAAFKHTVTPSRQHSSKEGQANQANGVGKMAQPLQKTTKYSSASNTNQRNGSIHDVQEIGSAIKTEANKDKEDSITDYILNENDQDPLMWQAVRASAAAPFFFKPYGPYLDGGIISNNPTLDMLSEFHNYQKVRQFLRKRVKIDNFDLNLEPPSKLDLVVSLGTGRGKVISRQAMIDFGQVASGFATVFSPRELVRSIRAARDLFKKLMQQSCQTEDHILDRAQAWCASLEIPYFRINPPLATIFSIDDKRDEQLINALWQTKIYMKAMSEQLNELGDLL